MTTNICIIGDTRTGKTAFINRHVNGSFSTISLSNPTIEFNTTIGKIGMSLSEVNNLPATKPDVLFVFFDPFVYSTWVFALEKITAARQQWPDLPIVVCGTMADKPGNYDKPFSSKAFERLQQVDIACLMISNKTCYQFDKPIIVAMHKTHPGQNITICE